MRHSSPSRFLGKVRIVPRVPQRLAGLRELSRNLWWSWHPHARKIFRLIDLATWIKVEGNPVEFLMRVSQRTLDAAEENAEVLELYDQVMEAWRSYSEATDTWFDRTFGEKEKTLIGYFSAEYGLHRTLPIYSGGLGVLAGDYFKSCADLGIPVVGIGLLYREGYFQQVIDETGRQQATYPPLDLDKIPVDPVRDKDGGELRVQVEMDSHVIHARVWRIAVGRNNLYLMDTDVPENPPEFKRVTARLYGGDADTRIQQEMLLGIGGIRLMRKLGVRPTTYHMNEGHSVFLALERMREFIEDDGLHWSEAIEIVRCSSVFTTHTPVPAGNDMFEFSHVEKYFHSFYPRLGMEKEEFHALGRDELEDGRVLFSLTALALRLSAMANGVSAIHGEVSRKMWSHLWQDLPPAESPIEHVTNGVHTLTWMSLDMQDLLDAYFPPNWRENVMEPELWNHLDRVPDEELWQVLRNLKGSFIRFVHDALRRQHKRFGETAEELRGIEDCLTEAPLTIGFARRFATYKRATLIFHDKERLRRMLNHPKYPVQLVFAGKAHPADVQAQELIRQIQAVAAEEGFRNRVAFIENYDMNVGNRMTSGVDVWLNNPRRPLEASGTSGMKVPLNGGLNASILDGWWPEAYHRNPLVGWAIGDERHYDDPRQQDEIDSASIYSTLEREIIPLYFERDEMGVPRRWLKRVRESFKTIAPLFSTDRMAADYTRLFYAPGTKSCHELRAKKFEGARKLAAWKKDLLHQWPMIAIEARVAQEPRSMVDVNESLVIEAEVALGTIPPEDVSVEIFLESTLVENGNLPKLDRIAMVPIGKPKDGRQTYRGELEESESGEYAYTVRVIPRNAALRAPAELGLVRWA